MSRIPRPYQGFHELRRILRPGGAHVFTVPFSPVRPVFMLCWLTALVQLLQGMGSCALFPATGRKAGGEKHR